MSRVVLVCGDDWEGLYIDSTLKREDHMLTTEAVLDTLGIEYEYVWVKDGVHWETWGNRLPPQLAAVKKALVRGWPG